MVIKTYNQNQLLLELSTILKDIQQGINDLNRITDLVSNEKQISSYEQTYCKQCKEPCGRSNAEIYKCMMARKQLNNESRPEEIQQYTKEYLEKDLKEIVMDLEKKEKHLKQIMEKIEKGNAHS